MKLSFAISVASLLCATAQAQIVADDCASPNPAVGAGTHDWDNSAATTGAEGQTEASCYAFGTSGIDADVWTEYLAGSTGCASITVCNAVGSITDSKIAVYPAGGCPTAGTSLACNDDTCGLLSEVSLNTVAGQTYLIQLGNFPGAAPGTSQIDIIESGGSGLPVISSQDDCANATTDVVGPGSYRFNTLSATTGTQGQNEALCYAVGTTGIDNDVWFVYTATVDACAQISTCNSDQPCAIFADTKIAVYPGTGCPTDGTSIACNDDACNGLRSQVVFPVVSGQSYLVQIGSFPGAAAGSGIVDIAEVNCPVVLSNQDDCGNASVDTIGPGQFGWDNLLATTGTEGQTEASCYKFGTSGIQSDIWALYVPEANGSVTIESCGSVGNTNTDTKIAAYPAADCSMIDGTSVACNDDTCGLLSQITFSVNCGQSYLVQLGSFPGSGDGTATMFINETGAPCGPGPIGFTPTECNPGNPNSTGVPATIRAEGQELASAMDVEVIAESVPPGQFGYFFASRTLGFIPNPGGSLGNICVLGNQGRYNNVSQIGTGPTLNLDVGTINVPTNPAPGEMIMPGDTWYWQCWHRDIGNNNNFTNVVGVLFN
ncbi:MAG: hypothetical protein GY711_00820 [bacterium]|nr:hypothetical protein [bacterium]